MVRPAAKGLVLLVAATRCASGWRDCSIALDDHWVPAESRSLPEHMLTEYDRRYTCEFRPGALAATGYNFQSACTRKTFTTAETKSCLENRRVIFIGDSLSTQQGDSLLGMLGWHPSFLTLGDPRNWKRKRNADGDQVLTLVDCWRSSEHYAGQSERCYDMFGGSMTKAGARRLVSKDADTRSTTENARQRGEGSGWRSNLRPHRYLHHRHHVSVDMVVDEEKTDELEKEDEEEEEEKAGEEVEGEGTSVHVRMFARPSGENWLERAVADFNATRPSDIFVVNFGAHYPDTAEDEEVFRLDMAAVLDSMAKLGETATAIWREIGPAHFPSANATYKNFQDLPESEQSVACCTGTPPLHLERNLWVEKYISDNGLADRVKLLKIYRMSSFRGSAHHSCHLAPPADPLDGPQGNVSCPFNAGSIDCLHFSETGVVESWNGLMLNHLCPPVE